MGLSDEQKAKLRAKYGTGNPALDALRRNVSGRVASGEAEAIVGIPASTTEVVTHAWHTRYGDIEMRVAPGGLHVYGMVLSGTSPQIREWSRSGRAWPMSVLLEQTYDRDFWAEFDSGGNLNDIEAGFEALSNEELTAWVNAVAREALSDYSGTMPLLEKQAIEGLMR